MSCFCFSLPRKWCSFPRDFRAVCHDRTVMCGLTFLARHSLRVFLSFCTQKERRKNSWNMSLRKYPGNAVYKCFRVAFTDVSSPSKLTSGLFLGMGLIILNIIVTNSGHQKSPQLLLWVPLNDDGDDDLVNTLNGNGHKPHPVCWRWEESDLLNISIALSCCSVVKSRQTLWDPMDCSMAGSSLLHCLPEFAQTHVHWVGDAI